MTREEAIDVLKIADENASCDDCLYYAQIEDCPLDDDCIIRKAISVAIQALSQEPCDDAISRDFQIGDEVRIIGSDPIYDDCDVGWVIRNASEKVKTMYVMRNDGSADEEAKAEWYKTGRHNSMLAEVIKELPSVTQKSGKCKKCKYFEYDSVAKVDGIPLIVAHEICNKWGDGCKTKEDGYCFLFEPQESEDKE